MFGRGRGSGLGRPGAGQGRALNASMTCRCPNCGHTQPHRRGTPCTAIACPKCGTMMRGERC
jgi:DNA-directed RNA polymerase subunit RPC12/RpoP